MFEKKPTITRRGKTVNFVQAVMSELGVSYNEESIIRAMQDARKPKRLR
jgi:hypothetical protein